MQVALDANHGTCHSEMGALFKCMHCIEKRPWVLIIPLTAICIWAGGRWLTRRLRTIGQAVQTDQRGLKTRPKCTFQARSWLLAGGLKMAGCNDDGATGDWVAFLRNKWTVNVE